MPADLCAVLWSAQCAVVRLPEEVDLSNADQVRRELLAVVGRAETAVVADLSATAFCDSAGVAALVRAARGARDNRCELRVVCDHPGMLHILAILGADRVIDVYPDLTAALAGPPAG